MSQLHDNNAMVVELSRSSTIWIMHDTLSCSSRFLSFTS
jgi:hypothetical protein